MRKNENGCEKRCGRWDVCLSSLRAWEPYQGWQHHAARHRQPGHRPELRCGGPADWANRKKLEGYTVLDIREVPGMQPSTFYDMEEGVFFGR
jgi:hypothetical protein